MTQIARTGGMPSEDPQPQDAFTMAEKFELLSAYMDDEVTEQERQLVEKWLALDRELQKQYQGQLKLRLAMRSLSSEIFPSSDIFPGSDAALSPDQPPKTRHVHPIDDSSCQYSRPDSHFVLEPLRGTAFF